MKKTLLSLALLSALVYAGDYTNSIGMKFKDISSGSFMMGTQPPGTENCPQDNPFTSPNEYTDCANTKKGDAPISSETPAHKVSLKSFYMAETEVTQGQWYTIMGNNPAEFKTGNPDMPVEQVSWEDARTFVDRLNAKENTNKYRLPTEEEWEYAARAGTNTKWYCGNDESCVNSIAVSDTNTSKPVKSRKQNAFGLYDMSGNVWEWTDSCYTETYNKECYKNTNSTFAPNLPKKTI